jgi:hypothetical protein
VPTRRLESGSTMTEAARPLSCIYVGFAERRNRAWSAPAPCLSFSSRYSQRMRQTSRPFGVSSAPRGRFVEAMRVEWGCFVIGALRATD